MAAVWPAGPEPMITNLECILRECVLEVTDRFEEESPAAGDARWLCMAAAATGREKKEKKREEDARRSVEANSLAVGAGLGVDRGRAGV